MLFRCNWIPGLQWWTQRLRSWKFNWKLRGNNNNNCHIFSKENQYGGGYYDPEYVSGMFRTQEIDEIVINLVITAATPDVLYYQLYMHNIGLFRNNK